MHHSETQPGIECSIGKLDKIQCTIRRKLFGNAMCFRPRRHPLLWMVLVSLATVGWGMWWLPLRFLHGLDLSMGQINAGVLGLAALVLAPLLLLPRMRQGIGHWATLISGALLGVALVFWNHALVEGQVLTSAVLFYLSPVWGGLIGRVFFGDGFNPGRLLAMLLALAAGGVVLGLDRPGALTLQKADLLALSAGLVFALSGAAARMGPAARFSRLWLALVVGAVALLPMRGGFHLPGGGENTWILLAIMAVPAILGLCVLFPLQLAAGRLTTPSVQGWFLPGLLAVELVTCGVSAAVVAGEPLGPRQALGVVLILGVAALERFRRQDKATKTAFRPGDHH